jgi:hypothetical protein
LADRLLQQTVSLRTRASADRVKILASDPNLLSCLVSVVKRQALIEGMRFLYDDYLQRHVRRARAALRKAAVAVDMVAPSQAKRVRAITHRFEGFRRIRSETRLSSDREGFIDRVIAAIESAAPQLPTRARRRGRTRVVLDLAPHGAVAHIVEVLCGTVGYDFPTDREERKRVLAAVRPNGLSPKTAG